MGTAALNFASLGIVILIFQVSILSSSIQILLSW